MIEEGDDGEPVKPRSDELDRMALRIHNLLSNGTGGIDWAGVPLWVELLGVRDVEGLLLRLETIVIHRAPEEQTAQFNEDE